MNVCGYARVSTDLQREKETITTQVELIERFCREKGHTLTGIYSDDGVSGTIPLAARPGGARLMEDAREGKFKAVVVYRADRIGRDVMVNETAARELHDGLGIAFLGVGEQIDLATPMGRAMFTFQSAIGRLERESTLQRSRDATHRLAREGAWLGGIVPFGYETLGKGRDARITLCETEIPGAGISEAGVVRWIYQLAGDEGLSCPAIANRLNARGIPTVYTRLDRRMTRNKRLQRTEGLWRCSRVRNLLIQTTYKGLHVWGRRGSPRAKKGAPREMIERDVPAVVNEDLWERAQQTLHSHRRLPSNDGKRKYLLRGLMRCANCGLTFCGNFAGGGQAGRLSPKELAGREVRGGKVYHSYYNCNGKTMARYIHGPDAIRCPSASVNGEVVERLVWSDIEGFLRKPGPLLEKLRLNLNERFTDTAAIDRVLGKLQADVAGKEAERASLYRLFRRGGISDADLERQLGEVAVEEKVLQGEADRLRAELDQAHNANRSIGSVEDLLAELNTTLDGEVTWETRRQIVEALVAGITVETHMEGPHRVPTLRIHYVFAPPESSDGTPTTGSMGIEQVVSLSRSPKAAVRRELLATVRDLLEAEPDATLERHIEQIELQHGITLSRASMCRLRKETGYVPSDGQAAAAKARWAGTKAKKTKPKKATA
jgi:site-specific DNA recombinase